MISLAPPATWRDWQAVVGRLIARGIPPPQVRWQDPDAAPDLFGAAAMEETAPDLHPVSAAPAPVWPAAFTREARAVLRHRDARRWDLLYGLAWRLASDGPRVLTNPVDPEVRRLHEWSMQVRRDVHKMHAFVRFRKVEATDGPVYVAWYRPDHLILPAVRSFFVERFGSMRWSILTPDGSLHWDGTACCSGPAACRQDAPDDDALEHLWRTGISRRIARRLVRAGLKIAP